MLRTYCVGLALDEETLKTFREAYRRACKYVEDSTNTDHEDSSFLLEIAAPVINGIKTSDEPEVSVQELESMTQQEAIALIHERLSAHQTTADEPAPIATGAGVNGCSTGQRIVNRDEALQLINTQGWSFIATWDNDNVIVAPPTGTPLPPQIGPEAPSTEMLSPTTA